MNERIVALDIGDARIGVAVSDESRLIATPIDTIYRVGYGPDVRKVLEICKKHDTTQVLSGWPLNMDGTAGFQSAKVKAFCEQLEKAGCPERAELPFQKAILNKELPYTIGGGIGQSRICMFFLRKAHIGEVQCSLWPEDIAKGCLAKGIQLL